MATSDAWEEELERARRLLERLEPTTHRRCAVPGCLHLEAPQSDLGVAPAPRYESRPLSSLRTTAV